MKKPVVKKVGNVVKGSTKASCTCCQGDNWSQ